MGYQQGINFGHFPTTLNKHESPLHLSESGFPVIPEVDLSLKIGR